MATYAKSLTTAQYQALVTGMPKLCPNATFTLSGVTYTTAHVVAFIATVLDANVAVAPAKAAWLEAIAAAAQAEAAEGQRAKEIRQIVTLMFKNDTPALAELGIQLPRPPAPLSAEARMLATAKLRATRVARGTRSKKQLSKIFGTVTGVTITPVTSATTPTSSDATPASGPANIAPGGQNATDRL